MSKKKVIIIGAGMAGLSVGCYLQMCGFDTEIFELGSTPGGLCTGWERKGYSFDGSIHWLVGTKPTVSFYHIWNELIDMNQLEVVDYDEYCAIVDEEGRCFTAYTDISKLEREMKRVSPEDSSLIDQFIDGIKTFLDFPLPVERPMELMSISEKLDMVSSILPKLPKLLKWYRMINENFAEKLHSPLLRRFFTIAYPGCFTMLVTLINCGWLHKKGAGYPIGGSVKLSRLMEQRYFELGGNIHYRSQVEKILVRDDYACGIELGGKQHAADIVISAADGRSTIYQMLKGAYKSKKIINMYERGELQRPAPMMFFSLGINRSFEGQPHWLFLPLSKKIIIDDKTMMDELALTIVNFDPSAAGPGKTCMTAMLSSNDCDYWLELRSKDKSFYDSEKKRICDQIIDALEEHFGDFKSHVEVCDLATPATYIRYTANWQASAQGWSASKKTFTKTIPKELPGLHNFYMVGQWVEIGGGVPMCMMSGRNVAQIICKRDNVRFIHNKNNPITEMSHG